MFIFRDSNLRPILGGILSYIPGLYSWWDGRRPTGNSYTSAYSKSIWKYHLKNYQKFSEKHNKPKIVAEFGTGASIGSLIAALKDDIKLVVGLDLIPYANNYCLNKKLVDEIIPFNKYPELNKKTTLEIKNLMHSGSESAIKYFAPWTDKSIIPSEYIEFIYSHSVLEHIDFPENAYREMFRILKKDGLMSHKIDHSSHKITKSWNGHYAINDFWWRIIRGRKPYLLNRLTPAEHKKIIINSGFKIIHEEYVKARIDENSHTKLKDNHNIRTSVFILKK